MARLRWPKSIHAQVEAIFSSLKAFGKSKAEADKGSIRSIGTWTAYLKEAHNFAQYLKSEGIHDLRDTERVSEMAGKYLAKALDEARTMNRSVQTQESRASAISAFERAFNTFFATRSPELRLDFHSDRKEYLALSRAYLHGKTNYPDGTRAYASPEKLVAAIKNPIHQLQATLQYQGGLRSEGVGAPSGMLANPLTLKNLRGYTNDPVTGAQVGTISVQEKGGKWTTHYVPVLTYDQLQKRITRHGPLQSKYREYRDAVIEAAKATGQYAKGRGTHGLKTTFAQRRYQECVRHNLSHEQALQATALELAHNRKDITLVYTRG